MKGGIFSGFAEFVEQTYSLATWQATIEQSQVPSKGEYLSIEFYDDSELGALLSSLSRLTGRTSQDLQRDFGHFFFPQLFAMVAKQVVNIDNLFDFLRAVDEVIHVEVKKSDPMAYTPTLLYDQPTSAELVIRYLSHRKMCFFAEGLILGAAEHFQQPVTLRQSKCLCQGDKHCLIHISS